MHLLIPPPLVALITYLLMIASSKIFTAQSLNFNVPLIVIIALVVIGLSIDLSAVYAFRQKKTTIIPWSPDKSSALVTHGIFAYSRNPMYLGLLFILSGLSLYQGHVIAMLCLVFFVSYMNQFQIKPEEKVLKAKFEQAYLSYEKKVRRWI